MHPVIQILSRYKITLLYSIAFGLLGGLVLSIPFAIGGLIVDFFLDRTWKRKQLFINYQYYAIAGIAIFALCTALMANNIEPVVGAGVFVDIFPLVWSQNFIDQMAKFIPVIDNYNGHIFNWESESQTFNRLFLMAFAWYLNILWLPLLVGDVIHSHVLMRKNNFYIQAKESDVPKFLKLMLDQENNPDGSFNPSKYKKRALKLMFFAPIFFGACAIFAFYLGFWGLSIGDHSTSLHATVLPFTALCAAPLVTMSFIIGYVLRAHYLHFKE